MNDIVSVFLKLPGFELVEMVSNVPLVLKVKYVGKVQCPHCSSERVMKKDKKERRIRHYNLPHRAMTFLVDSIKHLCRSCKRYFWTRFDGMRPWFRHTETFKWQITHQHHQGVTAVDLSKDFRIGHATVSRWYIEYLRLKMQELKDASAPRVLGIDEHFFTRKRGYATTLCDLGRNKVFDVTLGRSESSLRGYLEGLHGRENTRVAVMDLSGTYRSIVEKYFPNALIVADRFHVIRTVNHHFLNTWKLIEPDGRGNRGLLSLMRRHGWNLNLSQMDNLKKYLGENQALLAVYDFKQELVGMLLNKHQTARNCKYFLPKLLNMIRELLDSHFEPMKTLGKTLKSWVTEIVRMWRFTKTNGITEGFHNKMEMMSRRAYGFRKFQNYRMKVRVMCS